VIRVAGLMTGDTPITETVRWVAAVLTAAGLHAGAVAWMLRSQPAILADNTPPAAIMIELADLPEAATTEKNEITPDKTSARESVAQEEKKSDDVPETKPPDQVAEPEASEEAEKEPVEDKPAPIEKVEDPLPAVQPRKEPPKKQPPKKEPPKKVQPKEKPKPRNQQAAPASAAATQAQARVAESERTAAAQTASGVSSLSPANWQSQLMAHLERRKRYPPGAQSRGERGIVYVRFTIDGSGNVQSVGLSRSSGHAELDQEVLEMVRRASPVPAPPPGVQRDIIAPVRFSGS
jgi:protein TonB